MDSAKRPCGPVIAAALAAAALSGWPAPALPPVAPGAGVPAVSAAAPVAALGNRPAPPPRGEAGCKLRAPLQTDLVAEAEPDGSRRLSWEVRPLSDFDLAGWRLELSPGVALRAGAGAGAVDARRDRVTRATARVSLPAGASASVTLVAWGRWPGDPATGSGAERVEVRRRLQWGPELRAGSAEVLAAPGAASQLRVAALPSVHRPGR